MKFITTIATFVAAAVSGAYANASTPQRKRTIENKYVTSNVIVEEKADVIDLYLGLSHRSLGLSNRKLEKDSSMSMDHGEYDTPGDEGGDCSGCSGACISIAGEVTCCKGSIIDNRCTGDSTVTTADGVSTDYGKGENVIGGDSGVTIDDDGVNSSPIMVGSWVVGGAAIITAVVGW